jgi:oxysterol-binding protein-related protein 3/6/7
MLAETFEDVRMRFIAEKVTHQPLAMAFHAEGEGWVLYGTSAGKTKFWGMVYEIFLFAFILYLSRLGKSLEIIPLGTTHLKIGGDHFTWQATPDAVA